jgi:ABC-2 type transport system ATP-binding protein
MDKAMLPALHLEGLTKHFGATLALQSVSLSVTQGERVALLGLNGAGKSTLMRLAAGVLKATHGVASIIGRTGISAQRALGYLPEGAPLYGELTVLQQLRFAAQAHAVPIDFALVDQLSLTPLLHRPTDSLSKGMRRRVALALALQHRPTLMLLDEPMDGLDPQQKQAVRALLLSRAATAALVFSTHVLDDVVALAERLVLIYQGRILADCPVRDFGADRDALEARFLALTRADAA